jgi:hypothetical protein
MNFTEKYFDEEYKIFLLTAVAKSINESNINVNICLGVPIFLFRDKQFVNRIISHIKNFGANEIEIDGKIKNIKINDVFVWLEGALLFYNYEKYSTMKLLVVDIGGYSVDVLKIMYGKIDDNDVFETGIYTLSNSILKEVNKEYSSDLQDGLPILDAYVLDKPYKIRDKAIEMRIVDALVKNYTDGLMSKLNQRFSMADCHIIFMGGGANTIKNKLNRFNSYDIELLEQSEFVNSFTFENICIQKSNG